MSNIGVSYGLNINSAHGQTWIKSLHEGSHAKVLMCQTSDGYNNAHMQAVLDLLITGLSGHYHPPNMEASTNQGYDERSKSSDRQLARPGLICLVTVDPDSWVRRDTLGPSV